MLYKIINMSDPYTIKANSLDVALVACIALGSFQYAFDPLEDGGERVPMFMFGGSDEWCQKHFGVNLAAVVLDVRTNKRAELAECFDSCLIGRQSDRATYEAGLELIDDPVKRQQWRDRWLDERRSSMNNIGARAYAAAEAFRKPLGRETIERAPQQVFST